MKTLIAHLLHVAVGMTGHPLPPELPPVQVVAAAQMPCACLGATLYPSTVVTYGGHVELPTRVLVADTVDVHTTFGASILLHELVHALQAQEGPARPGSPLWYQREREAYGVQQRYLMTHGIVARGHFGLMSTDD